MKPVQITTILLALSPLAAAWPTWLPDLDSLIVRRQDDDSSATTASPQETATPTAKATTTATTKGKSEPTTTNLNQGGKTTSKSGSGTGTKTAEATHTEYDAQDPAGSVVMITPAATSGTQLYKIGDYVTWGWNYTNVQGNPTAIDVLVSCSKATNTWTLTQNMTFATEGAFTWDTGSYQQTAVASPLLTEQYTLLIYDAESSVSATAEAGYLSPFSGFVFGLYTPRPYTPLAEGWKCATCSAALSDNEKRALGFAFTMAAITVASFTWFVTGLW